MYVYTHMSIHWIYFHVCPFFVRILITQICEVLIYIIGAGFSSRLEIILCSGLVYVANVQVTFFCCFLVLRMFLIVQCKLLYICNHKNGIAF